MNVDDLLERARRRIVRVGPHELEGLRRQGGLVIDIRPEAQRRDEGPMPGALVVERNVLEWRVDPRSPDRIPLVHDLDQPVIVVCSAGCASSLAAASLVDMGFTCAGDLVGGFQAWRTWFVTRDDHGAGHDGAGWRASFASR